MQLLYLTQDETGTYVFEGKQNPPGSQMAVYPGYRGGFAGIGWLDKVVEFFKSNSGILKGVWKAFKGPLSKLRNWAQKAQNSICVSDCGTYYIVQVTDLGVSYKEVSDPGGRTVIPGSAVPGWVSPCTDRPATGLSPSPSAAGAAGDLMQYWPYAAAGLGLLLLVVMVKK